ncbi:MAG: EAL domain-containing protein [Xanthomonadales bacterium]|nr:EAL domain-containing protein [Xanthomonadales bacterium]
MLAANHPVRRFLLLTTLFVVGAWLSTWFIQGSSQVTLIWPPAGVAMGALIVFGLRAWPFIAVGVLLLHLVIAPAPWPFIPFSLASNLGAALIAAAWTRRRMPQAATVLSMRSGLVLFEPALVSVVVGGVIGAAGLVAAGMAPVAAFWGAALRWALGDLFGAVAVLPSMLIAFHWQGWRSAEPLPFRYAGIGEKWLWCWAFAVSLLLVALVANRSGAYALGFAVLPIVFVIWSAIRFEPLWTALSTTTMSLYLATLIGLGHAGLAPPKDLASIAILTAFLCILTAAPLIVTAAAHENRVASVRALRRASRDALTGLVNRPAFEDGVRQACARKPRELMALAYLDLDQFKLVNDTLSHGIGDELLRSLAAAIASVVRPGDLLARLGGDEFALLLRDVDRAGAERVAGGLRNVVADFRYAHGGRVIAPTVSIGLIPFAADGADYAALFAQADAACFTAKELGGNRVQVALPDDRNIRDRHAAMDWAVRIDNAIEHGHLRLFAQVIAPLRAEPARPAARHFEILLRIHDPETGTLLEPGPYIAAAERFKFATRLDRQVLQQTLAWLEAQPHYAAQCGLVGINLSGASVVDDEFAQFVEERIRASSVAPQQLCFEITETSAVRDLAQAQRFIQRVRALGCKFALDDFGAGFCSFAYLNALDVDFFKIDGSFVRDLHTSPLALAIVRSIAEIARVLHKQTVAECTESESVRTRLAALGVDYAQGFAIGRPLPLEQIFLQPDPALTLREAS